jgi:hypothetical protein
MKPRNEVSAAPLMLTLRMSKGAVSRFLPLLGEGILLKGPAGETVEDFLQKAAAVAPAYLKERVQTVFLNGKALDDFSTARVADGDHLALSAAMPGLAGAVLRRGGFYSAMRRQISYEARPQADDAAGEISVVLKLFNMVARELGPDLLRQGILVSGVQLMDFVERQGRWAWKGCLTAEAGGQPVAASQISERLRGREWIRLSVHEPD